MTQLVTDYICWTILNGIFKSWNLYLYILVTTKSPCIVALFLPWRNENETGLLFLVTPRTKYPGVVDCESLKVGGLGDYFPPETPTIRLT